MKERQLPRDLFFLFSTISRVSLFTESQEAVGPHRHRRRTLVTASRPLEVYLNQYFSAEWQVRTLNKNDFPWQPEQALSRSAAGSPSSEPIRTLLMRGEWQPAADPPLVSVTMHFTSLNPDDFHRHSRMAVSLLCNSVDDGAQGGGGGLQGVPAGLGTTAWP